MSGPADSIRPRRGDTTGRLGKATADDILIPAWVDGVLQPVDKLAVHRQGLRHPAISVFVTRGDQILLQKRAEEKYHTPGLWANTCCTHPRWGESAKACAERRLVEELGISNLRLEKLGKIEYRADVGNGLIDVLPARFIGRQFRKKVAANMGFERIEQMMHNHHGRIDLA